MAGNIPFLQLWNKIGGCFRYTGSMAGALPTSLNWSDVLALTQLLKITVSPLMIDKIQFAEQEYINEALKR